MPPIWIAPMLATLTSRRFDDPAWVFERKLDGERLMAIREDGEVRLWTRNRIDVSVSYPEIIEALRPFDSASDWVLDGELCAMRGDQTSFEDLQKRMHVTDARAIASAHVTLAYVVFDLPRYDGHDLQRLPLTTRKDALRDAYTFSPTLRFSEHQAGAGTAMFHHAESVGWEGVMAKRAASTYQAGRRSPDWLKLKVVRGQELVVGGWTDPQGARSGLGALLLGYYEGDDLRYAGKVGTGFDEKTLAHLGSLLAPLSRSTNPFADSADEIRRTSRTAAAQTHWVEPRLVVQIGFSEWTGAGRLRHPRYQGLRDDKDPREVVREEPHPIGP
ncbi:non-homologous end-joining DNA ligase [Mumia sp. zg.B17]|uniref:non-homologous end-joining DNA ligase n=1 Tax=unclassified Mumia TaxID=2621872 RepID=UPI001C6EE1BA|nr:MULTISPECIES: non-homologous end-joining DNA ligase [unclassified Mumia]MBW9204331.1 non-homologous end-joining DNA ligase [Mumia sp. zg.B17]MDD9348007.1 non-homologous end-joining DNA ligase [Mumia sp.]